MTTEDASSKLVMLLICAVSMCVLGSFVVSFDIKNFIYLIIAYAYIVLIVKLEE